MRLISFKEFINIQERIVFSEYEPCVFTGLKIKGESIFDADGVGIDFFYVDLIGNVKSNGTHEFVDILSSAEKSGSRIDLDFKTFSRDGAFDNDRLFAIYDDKDIFDFVVSLTSIHFYDIEQRLQDWLFSDQKRIGL